MSLMPRHWPQNADAGAHPREMEGGGQMGLSILLHSLLIFLPPSVLDHDTHWLHNREQGRHSKYFSSNITNYVFIDLLPPTSLLMLFFISPSLPLSLSESESMNTFCVAPKSYLIAFWSWHFVISDIRIKWDILATEWWMTMRPDKNRSQISLKYLLICETKNL